MTRRAADAEVQEERRRFEEMGYAKKRRLGFDTFLEYFRSNRYRFSAIAKMAGITRQAVQQLYKRYFQKLCDGRTGNDRQRRHLQSQKNKQLKQVRTAIARVHADERIQTVAQRAAAAGCAVSVVVSGRTSVPTLPSSQEFLANGHRCLVRRVRYVWVQGKSRRGVMPLYVCRESLRDKDALLVLTEPEGFPSRVFVFPKDKVLRLFWRSKKRRIQLYLPVDKSLPSYPHARMNFWQFADNWSLLSPVRQAA